MMLRGERDEIKTWEVKNSLSIYDRAHVYSISSQELGDWEYVRRFVTANLSLSDSLSLESLCLGAKCSSKFLQMVGEYSTS